jgi:FkbM family methyltransferase
MEINKFIKIFFSEIGTLLLAYDLPRNIFNNIYVHLGGKFINLFVKLFDSSRITKTFLWKDIYLNKEILMPVSSSYPLVSWQVALSSRWAEPQIRQFSEFYIKHNQGNKIFFDIGANHGLRSYAFLLHGYHCILFEPQASCNQFVREVALINHLDNLVIEECVLSDEDTTIDFFISSSTYLSSLSQVNAEKDEPALKTSVRSKKLDDYCATNNLHPSLVKIDVEGHEWAVIMGGRDLISKQKPTLIIEIWGNTDSKQNIYNFLINLQYKVFSVSEKYLILLKTLEEFMDCTESDFVFCADKYMTSLIYEISK